MLNFTKREFLPSSQRTSSRTFPEEREKWMVLVDMESDCTLQHERIPSEASSLKFPAADFFLSPNKVLTTLLNYTRSVCCREKSPFHVTTDMNFCRSWRIHANILGAKKLESNNVIPKHEQLLTRRLQRIRLWRYFAFLKLLTYFDAIFSPRFSLKFVDAEKIHLSSRLERRSCVTEGMIPPNRAKSAADTG